MNGHTSISYGDATGHAELDSTGSQLGSSGQSDLTVTSDLICFPSSHEAIMKVLEVAHAISV